MRRHDSPGERRALTGTDAPAPYEPAAAAAGQAAADRAGGEPADGTDGGDPGAEHADTEQPDTERADTDGAGPDPSDRGRVRPGGLDGLLQRLERLPASHPSSPGYGGHRHGGPAAWPPRAGEPYRPWFTSGEPGEPWFTEDPGDPAG